MVRFGFNIGDHDWFIMGYLNIDGDKDLRIVYGTLLASGLSSEKANNVVNILSRTNNGYSLTNFKEHSSIVCASKASSYGEMFSTVTHEIKHITEHISDYYKVNPKSEEAAYLQGEISRKMYDAVALVICNKNK